MVRRCCLSRTKKRDDALLARGARRRAIFLIAEQLLLADYNIGGLNNVIPYLAMVTALLAFEGYLFARGLTTGKESGRINTSGWGFWTAFAVSALAGVASSLPIVGISIKSTDIGGGSYRLLMLALAGTSGVGATLMAYLGAENIGVLYNRHKVLVDRIWEEYEAKLSTWGEAMQNDYRRRGRTVVFGESSYSEAVTAISARTPRAAQPYRQKGDSIQVRVRKYLADKGLTPFQVGEGDQYLITPNRIAVELSRENSEKGEPEIEGQAVRTALSRERAASLKQQEQP